MSLALPITARSALVALAGWLALAASAAAQAEIARVQNTSLSTTRQIVPGEPQLPQPVNPSAQPAAQVKIVNWSKQTFNYQVSRTSGPTWTSSYSLPDSMMHTFTADPLNQRSIIRTLNVFSNPGYLFIRFSVPNGFEVFKILTGNSYVYMVNANGYGELFEGTGSMPGPRTPAGAQAQALFELGANHAYYANEPGVGINSLPAPAELRQFPTAPREPMPLEQPAPQPMPIQPPAPQLMQAPQPLPNP
jgi:hypothetical protein